MVNKGEIISPCLFLSLWIFPGAKKSSYAAQVEQSTSVSNSPSLSFLPVPGPQGPQGPAGRDGKDGKEGKEGPQGQEGKPGPRGERGFSGKDGVSSLSSSGQQAGWAVYSNLNKLDINLGVSRGDDGWVSIFVDGKGEATNEKYLPTNTVSLWNSEARRLNFRGLKEGSHVFVKYNFELTTFNSNTELWVRTLFPNCDLDITQFVASLKYQYTYNLSVTQDFFIENQKMWSSGALPQIRTDYDSMVKVDSIYVSVI